MTVIWLQPVRTPALEFQSDYSVLTATIGCMSLNKSVSYGVPTVYRAQ